MSFASLVTGQVGSYLLSRSIGIIERWAGYQIATKYVTPVYENIGLKNIVGAFIKEPTQRKKILSMLENDPKMRQVVDFTNFLKWFNLNTTKVSLVSSIASPEMGRQVSNILQAVNWSYGLGWLSWVALSPILNTLVSDPASQTLQENFPTKTATRGVIEGLFKRGILTEEQLKAYYKQEGFTDEAIKTFLIDLKADIKDKEKDLSKAEILRAYDLGVYDRAIAKNRLINIGYSKEEAETLLKIEDLKAQNNKVERNKDLTKTDILKAFRKKLINENQAIELLTNIGYDEDEAKFIIYTEAL